MRGGMFLVMVGCLQGQIENNFLGAVPKPGDDQNQLGCMYLESMKIRKSTHWPKF